MATLIKDKDGVVVICDCGITHLLKRDKNNEIFLESTYKDNKDEKNEKNNNNTDTENRTDEKPTDSWDGLI